MKNSLYITKTIKSQSTGTVESAAQAFSQNYWVKIKDIQTGVATWYNPVYTLEGATRNYYEVDYNGLSTDINNGKNIVLIFSSNTFSISGITILNHKLYRINYKDFVEAKSSSKEKIIESLSTPFYTFIDYASGGTGVAANISAGRYVYNFPTTIKPTGQFTVNVFEDKSQYFIDSEFLFPSAVNTTLGDFHILSSTTSGNTIQILDYYKNNYEILSSNLGSHVITGDTFFSGVSVTGAFFTYMIPPNKPNLYVSNGNSQIAVQGTLSTFSPTFNFSNVEDGDYYQLQVSYDVTDFLFEDSSVATFDINKQEGDSEFVRTYSTPLTPRKEFLYRIGNVKEIENIFGVKQATVVYTDYVLAETANDGKFIFSGTAYQGYISPTNVLAGVTLELRGASSSSTFKKKIDVKNANIALAEQDVVLGGGQNSGILLSTTSDANGVYSFGRVDGGTYYLTIIPPVSLAGSVQNNTYTISVSADVSLDVILSIIWGSTTVTFNDPYTFL